MSLIEFMSRAIRACFALKGSGRTGAELEAHFWSKVDRSGDCWLWTAGKIQSGYGAFHCDGKLVKAHRFAYTVASGPIPDGLCVCHRCDVRACCNPAHLFLGTHGDNIADMIQKGRKGDSKGINNGQSKLTDDIVREIRETVSTHKEIAVRFGVTPSSVTNIRNRKIWRHVPDEEGFVQPPRRLAAKGINNGQSKLTDDIVREIRAARGTHKEIAAQYGVCPDVIYNVKKRRTWKHVSDDPHQSEPIEACFGLDVGNHVEGLYSHYLRLTKDAQAASQLVASHIAAQREPPDEKLLDVEQVSSILNVNQKLVRAMTKDGRLRSVRVGNLIRVKRQWLDTVMTPTSDW